MKSLQALVKNVLMVLNCKEINVLTNQKAAKKYNLQMASASPVKTAILCQV